jgi:hypothetical protein
MQYIFFTGAPGSRWSGVSQVFRDNLIGVDNSDLTPNRTYKHHLYSGHVGNYYGPGMLYGDWLDTKFGSREQWETEIARSYTDDSKPVKLVLSHNFAHYLDDLVKTFPESKLVLCYRRSDLCFDWWHAAGGWDIGYPNYSWYKNDDTMKQEIQKQNRAILDFAKQKNLKLEQPNRDFFRNNFNIDKDFIFEKDVSIAVY